MADGFSILDEDEFGDDLPMKSNVDLFGESANENKFVKLLNNPNFIKALAKTGEGLDPTGFGGSLGRAASEFATNEALQKAGAKQSKNQANLTKKLIGGLNQGTLLSDPEDNDAFDNLTIDGAGNATLKFKNTPKRESEFSFASAADNFGEDLKVNKKLIGGAEPSGDFDSLSAEDLQGLGPDEIKFLLEGSKGTTDLRTKLYNDRLVELKHKRDTEAADKLARAKVNASKVKRGQELEDFEIEQKNAIDILREKARLGTPLSPSDRIMMKRLEIDMAQLGLQKEKFEKSEEREESEVQVLDKQDLFNEDKPLDERVSNIHNYNKKYDSNEVFYYKTKGFGDKVTSKQIPPGLKIKGKAITSKMITELAEKNSMTVEEVLEQLEAQYDKMKKGKK